MADYRDLLGEPDLCRGGSINSIVFCCNKPDCPVLKHALNKLGISYEEYVKIKKEESQIAILDFQEVDLAFSRSLETRDESRDLALKKLEWTTTNYLVYKYNILKRFKRAVSNEEVFKEKIIRLFPIFLVDLNEGKTLYGMALGNIELGFLIPKELRDVEKDETLTRDNVFVGVRIPKSMLKQMDDMVSKKLFESRSEIARVGLSMVLRFANEGNVDRLIALSKGQLSLQLHDSIKHGQTSEEGEHSKSSGPKYRK